MSEKTFVPGFEEDSIDSISSSPRSSDEFKSRLSGTRSDGTVVPVSDSDRSSLTVSSKNYSDLQDRVKPIRGFLYSVSRTSFGEFWPLFLGSNEIGRGKNADVVLLEGTVSERHAVITIHQDDVSNEVFASLVDKESTHGVKLNGKNIRFDRVECHNMDVIKIGLNYELLFILIDSSSLNLKPAVGFIEVKKVASKAVSKHILSGTSSRIANPSTSERTVASDNSDYTKSGGTKPR